MHPHILINFDMLLFTILSFTSLFTLTTSFHLTNRKVVTWNLYDQQQEQQQQQNQQQQQETNTSNEEMERKMAWAKHTMMTVAASIMCVPPDVFTTPLMVDPNPPSTSVEKEHREQINSLLSKGYPNPLDGFEIPNEEIELIAGTNNSNGSGHNPSTYGEVTTLGARQLFHYMQMHGPNSNNNSNTSNTDGKNKNKSNNNNNNNNSIHFIDLGSGNGKLLVQAYLEIPNLITVEGIELSSVRNSLAMTSWDNIKEEAKDIRSQTKILHDSSSSSSSSSRKMMTSINNKNDIDDGTDDDDTEFNLYEGDLFQMDISTATHIYVASLCFTDEMIDELSKKIMNEGSDTLLYVATLKSFPDDFEVVTGFKKDAKYVEMSWTKPRGIGGVVYFYSKI